MSTPGSAGQSGARSDAQATPVATPPAPEGEAKGVPEGEAAAASQSAPRPVHRRSGGVAVLLSVIVLIAVAAIAFAAGRATAPGGSTGLGGNGDGRFGGQIPNVSFVPGNGGFGPFGGFGGLDGRGRVLTGTVVSVASDSITLKLANGQTVTIATTPSTTYHQQTAASASDVSAGQTVTIETGFGTTPGSATRTATDVTITK